MHVFGMYNQLQGFDGDERERERVRRKRCVLQSDWVAFISHSPIKRHFLIIPICALIIRKTIYNPLHSRTSHSTLWTFRLRALMHAFDRSVFIVAPQPLKLFLHSNRFIITAFKLDYNMLICAYCVRGFLSFTFFYLAPLSFRLWAPLLVPSFFAPFPIFLSRPKAAIYHSSIECHTDTKSVNLFQFD